MPTNPPDPALEVNDVVQLGPNTSFPYCFMVVTEVKSFGAQGYVMVPGDLREVPGQAYYRAKHEDMDYIGKATWIVGVDETKA